LQQIYENRAVVSQVSVVNGGNALFSELADPGKSAYWSSREDENNSFEAWLLEFFNGLQSNESEGLSYAVRCVRAF
jgi:hypothetical protein